MYISQHIRDQLPWMALLAGIGVPMALEALHHAAERNKREHNLHLALLTHVHPSAPQSTSQSTPVMLSLLVTDCTDAVCANPICELAAGEHACITCHRRYCRIDMAPFPWHETFCAVCWEGGVPRMRETASETSEASESTSEES